MIKLYHGEDTFESYFNAIKDAKNVAQKNGLELKVINADSIERVDEFTQEIEGVGMFDSESMIFAKRLLKNKKLSTLIEDKMDIYDKYPIIIWNDGKADGRSKFVKSLNKKKASFNYDLPKPWQIGEWIQKISKAKQISLSKHQIEYIAERLGTNKWIILNELNKVKLFIDSNGSINNEELDKVLGFDVNGDIWKFLDFFGNKQRKEMLSEFEKLIQYEGNIQYLIAMIDRELNLMYKVLLAQKLEMDYKTIGLHPFVLQKTIKKAKNYTFDEIKKYTTELLKLDTNIKRGEIDEIIGLSLYLSNI